MINVKEIRASIDQTLDRWEAAALAIEENVNGTLIEVSERIQAQKQKAAEKSESLKAAIARAQKLPTEAKDKISADLDHLKVQLALGKAEARDAVAEQQAKIAQAIQNVDNQINQFEQQIDKEIEQDIEAWIRAEKALQQELELAAMRYETEQAEARAQFAAEKQEILDDIKKFRENLNEKRSAAVAKGTTFASDMAASFEQVKTAFKKLTS